MATIGLATIFAGYALATYIILKAKLSGEMGAGDFVAFIAFPIASSCALASLLYIVPNVIKIVRSVKNHAPLDKKSLILTLVLIIIPFIPWYSPITLIYGQIQEIAEQAAYDAEYEKNGGPSQDLVNKVVFGTVSEARSYFDSCKVSSVLVVRYDMRGPWEKENMYLHVYVNENNYKYNPNLPPNGVLLPYSDSDEIKKLVNENNARANDPYASCDRKVEMTCNDIYDETGCLSVEP